MTQKLMAVKLVKNLPYSWCETKRSPLYKTVKLKEIGFLDYDNNEQNYA